MLTGAGAGASRSRPAERLARGLAPAPVAVVGPTATGKSALALELARRRPGAEIVSVDSMGVYRGMDIGTAKPGPEARGEVPHHLLDLADPSEDFSVQRFQAAGGVALTGISARGGVAVLAGGTGLYLRSVVDGLDLPGRWPELAASLSEEADAGGGSGLAGLHRRLAGLDPVAAGRILPTNRRRLVRALEVTLGSGRPFSSYGPGLTSYPATPVRMVALALARPVLDARIGERVAAQMEAGWLAEAAGLTARPGGLSRTAGQALGYRELWRHVEGELSLEAAVAETVSRTRRLARRQEAWFRRDPRIVWVDAGGPPEKVVARVAEVLGDW
ncbi:MAG: tRNA (adenosine(37)-N6)-dimethylallyltransferase MiaA [Acidimicrobiales bacterium]